jgi:hypothetical protein
MGYSTFRHFLKDQFPTLRFDTKDINVKHNNSTAATNSSATVSSTTTTATPTSIINVVDQPPKIEDS